MIEWRQTDKDYALRFLKKITSKKKTAFGFLSFKSQVVGVALMLSSPTVSGASNWRIDLAVWNISLKRWQDRSCRYLFWASDEKGQSMPPGSVLNTWKWRGWRRTPHRFSADRERAGGGKEEAKQEKKWLCAKITRGVSLEKEAKNLFIFNLFGGAICSVKIPM